MSGEGSSRRLACQGMRAWWCLHSCLPHCPLRLRDPATPFLPARRACSAFTQEYEATADRQQNYAFVHGLEGEGQQRITRRRSGRQPLCISPSSHSTMCSQRLSTSVPETWVPLSTPTAVPVA